MCTAVVPGQKVFVSARTLGDRPLSRYTTSVYIKSRILSRNKVVAAVVHGQSKRTGNFGRSTESERERETPILLRRFVRTFRSPSVYQKRKNPVSFSGYIIPAATRLHTHASLNKRSTLARTRFPYSSVKGVYTHTGSTTNALLQHPRELLTAVAVKGDRVAHVHKTVSM